jgi:hypothetical protein
MMCEEIEARRDFAVETREEDEEGVEADMMEDFICAQLNSHTTMDCCLRSPVGRGLQ